MKDIPLQHRIILPLDVPSREEAIALIAKTEASLSFYKIGFELLYSGAGLDLAKKLLEEGKKVFLDFKLLDIDNTVAKAVKQISSYGAHFLTIHAYPRAMRAAVEAREGSSLKLLGVTVMTHLDDRDLQELGYRDNVSDLVKRRAEQALEAGMDGLVCSAHEAGMIRETFGDDLYLVTPGIRLQEQTSPDQIKDDQKRVMTPLEAMAKGADHLVIGRPILHAQDIGKTVKIIQSNIEAGLEKRSCV